MTALPPPDPDLFDDRFEHEPDGTADWVFWAILAAPLVIVVILLLLEFIGVRFS